MIATVDVSTPTDRDVVLTRVFDAPRDLVFDALTKPELLKRWYGPAGWSLDVCEVDLRVGGKWRYVCRQPGGKVVGQYGVYKEIVPGARIVNTEAWEDWEAAGETLCITELVERGGKTTFTSTIRFSSRQVRDIVMKAGLTSGAQESYDKLEQVLKAESGRR